MQVLPVSFSQTSLKKKNSPSFSGEVFCAGSFSSKLATDSRLFNEIAAFSWKVKSETPEKLFVFLRSGRNIKGISFTYKKTPNSKESAPVEIIDEGQPLCTALFNALEDKIKPNFSFKGLFKNIINPKKPE